jgi:hypothetical protein
LGPEFRDWIVVQKMEFKMTTQVTRYEGNALVRQQDVFKLECAATDHCISSRGQVREQHKSCIENLEIGKGVHQKEDRKLDRVHTLASKKTGKQ